MNTKSCNCTMIASLSALGHKIGWQLNSNQFLYLLPSLFSYDLQRKLLFFTIVFCKQKGPYIFHTSFSYQAKKKIQLWALISDKCGVVYKQDKGEWNGTFQNNCALAWKPEKFSIKLNWFSFCCCSSLKRAFAKQWFRVTFSLKRSQLPWFFKNLSWE